MWAADGGWARWSKPFLVASALAGAFGGLGCGGGAPDDGASGADRSAGSGRGGVDPAVAYPSSGDSLPEGVTRDMVVRGSRIYREEGLCYSCHGMSGRGAPKAGASLRDAEWYHADGSYPSVVRWVATGIPAEISHSGMRMPPRGGADLTSEEVRAVAAWVWWFSRPHNRPAD